MPSVTIVAGSGNVLSHLTKANVTKTMLGNSSMDNDTQDNLLSFIRGYEADGTLLDIIWRYCSQ